MKHYLQFCVFFPVFYELQFNSNACNDIYVQKSSFLLDCLICSKKACDHSPAGPWLTTEILQTEPGVTA